MLIDIVILPPLNIRRKIGSKLKNEIGIFPNYFVVDNQKLIPHLSLWHLKTNKNKLKDIEIELKKIVKGQKPIKIISPGFYVTEKYIGCLDFGVKNTKELTDLKQKIFEKTYPLKTGMMPKFASFLGPYTKEAMKEVRKYGRTVGFHPHFTAGWVKNEKDIWEVVKKMKSMKFSFIAKEIYICEVDKWWQVKKIIKKIAFNK